MADGALIRTREKMEDREESQRQRRGRRWRRDADCLDTEEAGHRQPGTAQTDYTILVASFHTHRQALSLTLPSVNIIRIKTVNRSTQL
ncbi:hypothetical protein WR25_09746 [Diploscapter pachys]|uniref:Uncharacterized protein n=1 Tax=Diploscapter pachys TaxID=2018661 RepID=A0A2A2K3L2_9BILA|nr:hypothetical protein WR25_09746 [Diploscapter pachys]